MSEIVFTLWNHINAVFGITAILIQKKINFNSENISY